VKLSATPPGLNMNYKSYERYLSCTEKVAKCKNKNKS
jgi:hypothetical protein